ncbi:MAG: AAA family ATPase [Coriobacteriales bacterium]|jgi:MoxR-like ATPase|nr:AAA family ATPase [Coriobacteriales bacterium]
MIDETVVGQGAQTLARICGNIETVIIGKRESVELVVLSLIASGHVLIEDMPGTGKTSLVSALARSLDCGFRRIQFTPDIMPSDVTGFSIFNQKTRDFEFRPGGVMSNLVLADEINRASAKTQSALLEAMEERQVTVDSETHRLDEPFMVLATENPIEQYGTYPLPEAQLDRFLIKLSMGYPQMDEEVRIVLETKAAKARIAPVASKGDILTLRELAEKILVSAPVARYAVQVVSSTRTMKECSVGASPRGSIALIKLGQAHALLRGRSYVTPDDVKYLAPFVLSHRVILTHEARIAGRDARSVIETVLDSVAVPTLTEAEARGLSNGTR